MITINSQKLIIAIANAGYTAMQLSEVAGVSQVTLARFKAGTQKARPQTLGKIARALNVRAEDLI